MGARTHDAPGASVHAIVEHEAGASGGFSRLPRSSAQQGGRMPLRAKLFGNMIART